MNFYNIFNSLSKIDIHLKQNLIISGFIISVFLFFVTSLLIVYAKFKYKAKNKLILIFVLIFIWDLLTLGLRLNIFIFTFYAVICLYTGKLLIEKIFKINIKNIAIYCSEFLLGFYVLGFIYFLLSHRFFLHRFGLNFNKVTFIFLIILVCVHAFIHFKNIKLDFINIKEVINNNQSIIIFMTLTLVCCYLIVFNYNILSQWAWNCDKISHIKDTFFANMLTSKGFPFQKLYPFAFQQSLYTPISLFNLVSLNQLIMSNNFFGFINLFCIFAIPFEFSKRLGLNTFSSFLSSLLTVFYGAIGGPLINSYLGFINISTSIYHNTTEFYALPLVLLSVYYIYIWLDNKEIVSNIIISIFLLDISFCIKPSAYTILGPSICLLLIIMFLKYKELRNLKIVIPGILIVCPIVFWELYPRIFKIAKTTTETGIGKFGELYTCYFENLNRTLNFNSYEKLFFIIIFSLMGVLLATLFGRSKNKLTSKFYYLFLLPVFCVGLLVACLFIETGSYKHDGNFMWQVCLIGCCLMPFISEMVNGIKFKLIRQITYSILVVHMFSGFWHLIIYNIYSIL